MISNMMTCTHRPVMGLAIAAALVGARPASASYISNLLGGASNYAVLGIGGSSVSVTSDFEVYQSATVINGNVGEGPYSDWTHSIDCTINGYVDYDLTDSAPTIGSGGVVTGGIFQIDMSGIVADARNASNTAAALAPTQTFLTLTSGQTIVGNGGLNVIRINDDVTLSGGSTTLNIQGSASDIFIFQLAVADAASDKTLTLSGVTMNLLGGASADNILWNLNGLGGQIAIKSDAHIFGTFLAPDRGITVDHGNLIGAVIGGGGKDSHANFVSVHSSSQITMVPAPAALSLFAMAGLIGKRRRRA